MRANGVIGIATVIVLATLGLSALAQQPGRGGPHSAAPIKLRVATFTPGLGEAPDIPPGLAIAEYATGTRGYYIVQFTGPVEPAWREAVAALGGDLVQYLPDFAFKTRLTPIQAHQVSVQSRRDSE